MSHQGPDLLRTRHRLTFLMTGLILPVEKFGRRPEHVRSFHRLASIHEAHHDHRSFNCAEVVTRLNAFDRARWSRRGLHLVYSILPILLVTLIMIVGYQVTSGTSRLDLRTILPVVVVNAYGCTLIAMYFISNWRHRGRYAEGRFLRQLIAVAVELEGWNGTNSDYVASRRLTARLERAALLAELMGTSLIDHDRVASVETNRLALSIATRLRELKRWVATPQDTTRPDVVREIGSMIARTSNHRWYDIAQPGIVVVRRLSTRARAAWAIAAALLATAFVAVSLVPLHSNPGLGIISTALSFLTVFSLGKLGFAAAALQQNAEAARALRS